ncbi:Transposon TX1 uncharacterized 149 kDa protein ORF 2 [Takifugu flavidus]|uniref:Transposon TX1 uncharacterized 149 kDa protein ORF 2 n=1 Tax=Takifugu flavidus TaxID=433684 RepID=A0A5C6N941_9TELE|nr:Transposon TX1 uncharacterized 149 kDa protein ORF 2 [Takifugu flavidus]
MLKFNGSLCAPFRVRRGVRQGCALSGMLYALSLKPLLSRIRASVDGLVLPSFHKKIVLSAYADDIIVMGQLHKSEALAVGRWENGLPVLPQDLAWRRDGLKYLGVFIGDGEFERRNWLDVLEKIEGKIQKRKWLLPRMSYRGRTLVLNNLVASVLWHRLNCAEPPSGLLGQLQARVLSFFWDGKHWVQQGVLYLPREEGGQGLIHLASRTTTFRIQFTQRFLTGPADLMWRDVARCVFRRVSNLGLDDALFLTDLKFVKLNGLPDFYKSVIKAWALFKVEKKNWLLLSVLAAKGTHSKRSQAGRLGRSRAEAEGSTTPDPDLVAAARGSCSRAGPNGRGGSGFPIGQPLCPGSRGGASAVEEQAQRGDGDGQGTEPDCEDPFPEIRLPAHLGNLDGPLLRSSKTFSLQAIEKKTLYYDCVRVLNRRGLSNRNTSVWADRLGVTGMVLGFLGCACLWPAGFGVEHNWVQLALQVGAPVGNLHLAAYLSRLCLPVSAGVSVRVGSLFVGLVWELVWVPWCWLLFLCSCCLGGSLLFPCFRFPWGTAPVPVFLLPWRATPVPELPVFLEGLSCCCSVSPGGPLLPPLQSRRTASALSVSGHVREASVLRRTPEPSPVQEDCSRLRTHRCSEFPAVQGDCVWFGNSPMDLGRADAASRSPCGPGGLFLLMCAPLPCK